MNNQRRELFLLVKMRYEVEGRIKKLKAFEDDLGLIIAKEKEKLKNIKRTLKTEFDIDEAKYKRLIDTYWIQLEDYNFKVDEHLNCFTYLMFLERYGLRDLPNEEFFDLKSSRRCPCYGQESCLTCERYVKASVEQQESYMKNGRLLH